MTQLVLDVPPETLARIAREAEERGVTIEAIAAEAVEAWAMFDDEDFDDEVWDEGPEPESENVPLDQAFDELRARVAAARAAAK